VGRLKRGGIMEIDNMKMEIREPGKHIDCLWCNEKSTRLIRLESIRGGWLQCCLCDRHYNLFKDKVNQHGD